MEIDQNKVYKKIFVDDFTNISYICFSNKANMTLNNSDLCGLETYKDATINIKDNYIEIKGTVLKQDFYSKDIWYFKDSVESIIKKKNFEYIEKKRWTIRGFLPFVKFKNSFINLKENRDQILFIPLNKTIKFMELKEI